MIVLGLLSVFYLFPTAFGLLGRAFAPDLAQTGQADALVLLLPGQLVGGTAGDLLTALVIAGAFAAFLSTSSGLVVSLAGRDQPGPVRRQRARLPHRGRDLVVRAAGRGARDGVAGARRQRRARVRVHRVDALPDADARHLVARTHRAGAIAGMVTGAVLCGGAMVAGAGLVPDARPGWRSPPPGRCRQPLP